MNVNRFELIYLDHAAATPLSPQALEAMQPYFSDAFYNPSSPYALAVEVRRAFEDAKHRLAMAIGGKSSEIVVTAGATESINLLFASTDGHVVTTAVEHPAVLEAAKLHPHTIVGVDTKGAVTPKSIAAAITPKTTLVSVQLANNEIGTIQPLRDIAIIVQAERQRRAERGDTTPIVFHADASQGIGQLEVNVARLGVDAMTINAGKIYGPKQVALLWVASHVRLRPFIVGGGQERGLRSGTENVAGTIGFAVALEQAMAHARGESQRLRELRNSAERALLNAFPGAVVAGSHKKRLSGHLSISFPGIDAERLVFMLENEGVLVATGSACAANKNTRSHVLVAIGMDDKTIDGSLRLTFGKLSNEENTERALAIIKDMVNKELARLDS